jgi:hypothetical protein
MKTIMVRGLKALVDNEDYETLMQYRWRLDSDGYALTRVNGRTKSMHRLIMGDPKGQEVDHINHIRLDNQKHNLRICSRRENRFNRVISAHNTSGASGVSFRKKTQKWVANIQVDRRVIYLGQYADKNDAIKARKIAEEKYFGEFASL